MKRGYYLWDWFGTRTIEFDPNVTFSNDEFAAMQGAFKRFTECKKHGIKELEQEIAELTECLMKLQVLTIEDVET